MDSIDLSVIYLIKLSIYVTCRKYNNVWKLIICPCKTAISLEVGFLDRVINNKCSEILSSSIEVLIELRSFWTYVQRRELEVYYIVFIL